MRQFKRRSLSDKTLLKILCITGLLGLFSAAVYKISVYFPEWITRYYSGWLYPVITLPGKWLAALFPFSLGEILLILVLLFFLYALIRGLVVSLRRFIKKQPKPWMPLARCLMGFLAAAFCALTVFVWGGGLNYNAYTIAQKENVSLREHTPRELYALTVSLIEKANGLRSQLDEDETGAVRDSRSFPELCQIAQTGFDVIDGRYGMATGYFTQAKPALLSRVMCYTNITGIFPYIVPEPIINTMTPDSSLASTICHEMAHQRGIAREDEANFISFMACLHTGDPYFTYAGYYMGAVHCLNALYSVNYQLWTEAWQTMSEEMRQDIRAAGDFWKQFETPVAEFSDSVNNAYLQVNNIEDGVASYGRLVDYLLVFYDASPVNPSLP